MASKVTDPALLEKLTAVGGSAKGKKVADPAMLEMLNSDAAGDVDDDDLGPMDYVSEGMSGVNEGVADVMSLPSQALTGALSIGPFIANSLGMKTAYPDYVPDPGEHARDLMETTGAIRPANEDDMGARVVRRLGREVGRNVVPALGSASRAVQPIRTLVSESAMTLGSGTGAALANEAAPGNVGAEIAGQVLGGGVGSLGTFLGRKMITPNPASAERSAAANAMRNEGVELTAGQATGNRGLRYAESELGGGAAQEMMEQQAEQFTAAALQRAGLRANRATPDVIDRAYIDIGQEFDNLIAGTTIRADRQLGQELRTIQDEFNQLTGTATRPAAVENRINDIVEKVQQGGGTISGDTYKAMRSEIDTLARKSTNPELKGALNDLRGALDDAVERTLAGSNSPLVGEWRDVRGRYRNLVILTDAATRAGENAALGLISPANLRSAVAANVGKRAYGRGQSDLGELSRSGTATMAPLPDSGTASRTNARNLGQAAPALVGAGIGGTMGNLPGAVAGAALGWAVPKVAGAAMLSAPGRAYLSNQLMRPRMDPRGVSVASGVTMTLEDYKRQQQPIEITVGP